MGLRFRKSIKVGKFGRINLSGSGIGGSIGVNGARVGVSSRGRKYVRGGRHGVYFDETIGTTEKKVNLFWVALRKLFVRLILIPAILTSIHPLAGVLAFLVGLLTLIIGL